MIYLTMFFKIQNIRPAKGQFVRLEPSNKGVNNPFAVADSNTENYVFKFKGMFYKGKHKWTNQDGVEYNTRLFKYSECELKK